MAVDIYACFHYFFMVVMFLICRILKKRGVENCAMPDAVLSFHYADIIGQNIPDI
jgi:hypothetical protein